ncbi:OFA family MFS transporter [Actinacidiphila oryziradicis]|uniref:OFA family MFS transporter n=1 Tax=Actinacidiphila oryziradicis TaxID=2571141 RepID=A0A4U0SVI5_9ACTN|nr:OFA family MFS transporter [Actinacidiphila oryziradicis]TKA12097.1 OFA family MFS transporter [Actinacidiphila oryziradicis]
MTSPTSAQPPTTYKEIRDANGRLYRVGETDRDILGRPRWLMVLLPWAAMLGISVAEYAYGSAEDTLSQAHNWTHTNTFWLLSVWVVFQAGVAFPAGRLREKGLFSARAAMLSGAGLAFLGYLALSHAPNIWWAFAGFGFLGGTGAGLVYATCINMVGKWYPERRGGKTGFVNGGFAYGAVPLIFVFTYVFDLGNYRTVLDVIGVYVLLVVGISGLFFKDPPKNWWPAHIDPIAFNRDRKANSTLAKNPPAVKQFGPAEAIRTGMLPLMWICLVIIAGVSIFGIAFQVPFAKEMGFGPLVAASSMGVMAVVNGTGRGAVGWLSDRFGRKQTLTVVLLIEGLAQFGILWAGTARNEPLFLVFAFVSGFGGGAFYPLFAALVPDYFGENNNAQNYGLVYSAKLFSGLAGGGLGSIVIDAWGYHGAYLLAGAISLLAAALTLLLRQPGRDRLRDIRPNPQPISREMA